MPRTAALLLAALALCAALAVTVPAGATTPASLRVENRCGDIVNGDFADTPQDVRALGVSCRRARRLARQHYRSIGLRERCDLYKSVCVIDGWTCRRTFFGDSGTRVRCTSGERRVRWFYGV